MKVLQYDIDYQWRSNVSFSLLIAYEKKRQNSLPNNEDFKTEIIFDSSSATSVSQYENTVTVDETTGQFELSSNDEYSKSSTSQASNRSINK